ncbi:hypothetical protein [Streptomyces violaceusniger]|uniref:hypothetical protein n=1 Tax=Streptomyces violaceusniger TaxID=68280 RepID=UPI003827EFE3
MERDETGRRWAAAYLHTPIPRPAAVTVLRCPDHPETRLVRLLGKAWTCPVCLRPEQQPPPTTA